MLINELAYQYYMPSYVCFNVTCDFKMPVVRPNVARAVYIIGREVEQKQNNIPAAHKLSSN